MTKSVDQRVGTSKAVGSHALAGSGFRRDRLHFPGSRHAIARVAGPGDRFAASQAIRGCSEGGRHGYTAPKQVGSATRHRPLP